MLYLASPYSHDDPAIRVARFEAACAETAMMIREGLNVFSPIAYSHQFDVKYGIDEWEVWMRIDRDMLASCGELHVLMLPGWNHSKWVQAEIEHARNIGKPIKMRTPQASNLTVGGCCP